jgi:predicted AlkP superfamily pyrophosphatase or phosphodiesterase
MPAAPIILINAVGLTPRLLPLASRLSKLAERGWMRPLREVVPAVTSTAQATILTGKPPSVHGAVANGWLFRDTMEVRFWQQSNRLLQAEPIYAMARKQNPKFKCAKLFWWFNQGADVATSITPKPWYGADGNKVFGITGSPLELTDRLERELGKFPFHTFWGPMAGLPCTEWIAKAAANVVETERPDLTLVYLPHLDYDPQRFGPSGCDMTKQVGELDAAATPLLDAAEKVGARIWVVSEYGHCDVSRVGFLNRRLRQADLLTVRDGPFGDNVDLFASRAFAVCDHQLAHVYVAKPEDQQKVLDVLAAEPTVARTFVGEARAEISLDHPRSGEIVALSRPDSWFAYPFWLDDARAPDYARTVDIHRKIGFDPAEMFFDPKLFAPKLRAARRLLQKKLGFRMLMDVIPLDPSLVRGSHGLPAADQADRPLLIGDGSAPSEDLSPTNIHGMLANALGVDLR